jgi:hypothetical protein
MADQPVPVAPTHDDAAAPFDVVRRGFDREQVLERLRALGERIRELESRVANGEVRLPDAPGRPDAPSPKDPLDGVAEHVRDLVEAFDQEIDRQRRKAELEATVVIAEARTEAAQMRLDARAAEEDSLAEAERILKVAKADAETLRREALVLRESTLTELRGIRDRMRTSLLELESGLPEDVDGGRVIVLEEAPLGTHPPVAQPGGPPSA